MTSRTLTRDRRNTSAEDIGRLIADAGVILTNSGVSMSRSKLSRLVRSFRARVEGSGWEFFDFITNSVALSEERRRAAMANPEVQRVIAYSDPTGETAVDNVLRDRSGA